MEIPRVIIEPFGVLGFPKPFEDFTDGVIYKDSVGGFFFAPYIPMQVASVARDGKWVNFEIGRESLEDSTSGN